LHSISQVYSMELGFTDALEDAQYVHALQSGRLEPTKPLPEVTDEEIDTYVASLTAKEKELDFICQQPLGFYLVGG
jgi:hypothetical protein